MNCIPRPEYPRPQFARADWMNLNGQWQFEIDNGCSGEERGLQQEGVRLSGEITVPFCPESKLSGVEHKEFMYGVWYKRSVTLPKRSGKTVLHFGAVDHHCRAFVNGKLVGDHKGGYVSFSFDITGAIREGENEIAVFAQDDTKDRLIPSGKQSARYGSYGCYYTRTTGIWQTVWLEFMPESCIESIKYYPNIDDCSVTVEAKLQGRGDFCFAASYEGKPMGSYKACNAAGLLHFTVPLQEKHLWEVGDGRLYDVELTFGSDAVKSYFGLRQVQLDGCKFLINGKSVFQRLILDQGFYPEGIYTAPTEADLVHDIELSLAAGFNGARLHEKIFEERFLYHADRMGYIVWGEYPNWGLDHTYTDCIYGILPEWIEEVERDFNHPAIIGWCPYNETWDKNGRRQFDDAIALVYQTTKAMDPTRPCIDTSGNFHTVTDIFDTHEYEQDVAVFDSFYGKDSENGGLRVTFPNRQHYIPGQPYFVSEYGGTRWTDQKDNAWGYGNAPKTEEEFLTRIKGLTDVLLDNPNHFGFCYTQLYDVEQEQNGLYTYHRKEKFPAEVLRAIFGRKAAIEG